MSTELQPWIERLPLGPIDTNAYLIINKPECWVVDPGLWPEPLMDRIRQLRLTPTRILLTHGHCDHIAGCADIKSAWPDAQLCCPAGDEPMLTNADLNFSSSFGVSLICPPADLLLEHGMELQLGPWTWKVLDTSGHTVGGVSFYCPQAQAVLTGDALFAGTIGRTDIPNGDGDRLVANIRANLMTLPDSTRVLPGHGGESTVGSEKRLNIFLVSR
ncbi:MAG: MBL fold metallo-hydrolase [Planctomycetes bacterium]|jgi:hydroxyacylglutathione hydrolase|nr:MBL fold metallo-hydrolase [Planctomycetota bacterium]